MGRTKKKKKKDRKKLTKFGNSVALYVFD